jgi:hypothetical protein
LRGEDDFPLVCPQDDEEKINVMSDPYPKRKSLWVCGIEQTLGTGGHRREPND